MSEDIKGNLTDAIFETLNKHLVSEVESLRAELARVKAKSEERQLCLRFTVEQIKYLEWGLRGSKTIEDARYSLTNTLAEYHIWDSKIDKAMED